MSRSLFPLSEPLQFGIRLLRLPRRAGHQHGTTRYFCFTEPSPITGPPLAFGLGMALACFVPYYIRYKPNIIRYKTRYIHPREAFVVSGGVIRSFLRALRLSVFCMFFLYTIFFL